MHVKVAENDFDIARCYRVMSQLRPHIAEDRFVESVQRQRAGGYVLAYVEGDGEVAAVAGFRIMEMLSRGRFMYVDDLVTDETNRSRGFGDALFDWMVEHARSQKCEQLNLDSGVHRFDAHRFYFRKRMHIFAYNFTLKL